MVAKKSAKKAGGSRQAGYRILSLDGGGIRGVITLEVMRRIEASHPNWLDGVDLISGTSTGGLIALGLAKGMTVDEILDLYLDNAPDIFEDSVFDDIRDLGRLRGAEYSLNNLERVATSALGPDTTLGDLELRVAITAFNLHDEAVGRWKPKIFHNFPGRDAKDLGVRAWKVALYTSAAPTYFPSRDGFIDGGVFATNPSLVGLAQALDPRNADPAKLPDIRLLSLGTGTVPRLVSEKEVDWGIIQWGSKLVSIMLEGVADVARFQCQQLLGDRFHRLDPLIPKRRSQDFGLDDWQHMEDMIEFARTVDLDKTLAFVSGW